MGSVFFLVHTVINLRNLTPSSNYVCYLLTLEDLYNYDLKFLFPLVKAMGRQDYADGREGL